MPASQIDEQVVKMSFDNSNFDSNVNDSIKTLNNLDKRLAIFDDKEHLNNINTSFSNLANTFSIKGQIMFGVLTNLGKEIYNLGKRAFGALTKGIRDGVGEYHTIIESTEAIYQNVKQNGNSLKDVNNALDELNDYADKTIYNFGQMTRMIGMFSSAGVGLKSSVSTLKAWQTLRHLLVLICRKLRWRGMLFLELCQVVDLLMLLGDRLSFLVLLANSLIK